MDKIKEDQKDLAPIYLNYKRNNKWLGVIDYKSLCFIIGYATIVGYTISFLNTDIEIKISIFMALVIPIVGIFSININNESAIDMIKTIIKYIIMPKRYIYYNENLSYKDVCKYKSKKYMKL